MATAARARYSVDEADPRVQKIARAIKLNQRRADALIQVLHVVQDTYGHIPPEMFRYVSRELRVPASRVYGVATFYHYFSLKSPGEHNCVICTGTACYVKGAGEILKRLEAAFGLKAGQTTPDNRLGLQTARCVGACGLAPVAAVDNAIQAKATFESLRAAINDRLGAAR